MYSPGGMEWTSRDVLRLIKEYGARPALWNTENPEYKCKIKKHEAWLELGALFKCNRLEVERKMRTLLSQFRRERVKMLKLKKAGIPLHKVRWYAYNSFSFLVKQKLKNNLNAVSVEEENEHFNGHEEIKVEQNNQENQSECIFCDGDEARIYEMPLHNELPIASKNRLGEGHENQHSGGNRDEWAVFGEAVAYKMRKLPDDRTRCIIQHKINTILYEAELASYSHDNGDF